MSLFLHQNRFGEIIITTLAHECSSVNGSCLHQERNMYRCWCTDVQTQFFTNMLENFHARGQLGMDFFPGKHYYGTWHHILDLMMYLFITNMQLFTSQDIHWWTEDVWIIVMFLSAVLDSHSDGTHSLQRIHWWASDIMLSFSKSVPMEKKLIYILEGLGVSESSAWTIPLRLGDKYLFRKGVQMSGRNKNLTRAIKKKCWVRQCLSVLELSIYRSASLGWTPAKEKIIFGEIIFSVNFSNKHKFQHEVQLHQHTPAITSNGYCCLHNWKSY